MMSAKGERGVIWWERCVMFGTLGASSSISLPSPRAASRCLLFLCPCFCCVLETMLQMAIIQTSDRAGQQLRHFKLNRLGLDQTGSGFNMV